MVPNRLERPIVKKAGSTLPIAFVPSGRIKPTEIERPAVGISCNPVSRNMVERVASRSGTFSRTISKALTSPIIAPKASTSGTVS